MKSTKNTPQEIPSNTIELPVMMAYKDDSFIVLFTSTNQGTVVWSKHPNYKVGHHGCRWRNVQLPDWKPFNGSITLEN